MLQLLRQSCICDCYDVFAPLLTVMILIAKRCQEKNNSIILIVQLRNRQKQNSVDWNR